eukprot:6455419-Amphidinium_carterae.1
MSDACDATLPALLANHALAVKWDIAFAHSPVRQDMCEMELECSLARLLEQQPSIIREVLFQNLHN